MVNSYLHRPTLRRGLVATGVAVLVGLTGCASDGTFTAGGGGSSGGGASGGGTGNPGATQTAGVLNPLNGVIQQTGHSTSTLGDAIGTVGTQLVNSLPDGLNNPLTQGAGGALVKVGDAVDALGSGLAHGLGQLGKVENPVGVTAGSLEGVVVNTGQAVRVLGTGISAGVPQLGVVGNLVDQVGGDVAQLGAGLGKTLDSNVVQQVTRTASNVVVPITTGLLQTTQQVGETSGLGRPVGNLLTTLGGTVNHLGVQIAGDGKTPVISPVGQIVANTGTSVALLGGAVVLPQASAGDNAGGLGGLLTPVTGLLGGLGAGSGMGSGPLSPVTGLVGGLAGVPGGADPAKGLLAPVTGLVAGATGGLTGGSAAGGNLLQPVTGLLGGLTGGLKK